jgi:hypothetical protein
MRALDRPDAVAAARAEAASGPARALGRLAGDPEPSLRAFDPLPGDVRVTERDIDAVARDIGALGTHGGLDHAVAVGRLVIGRFYRGDPSAWRRRGRKDASLRKLAARLGPGGPMSPSSLFRCVASYELVERLGGMSAWKHLTACHVRSVLPLAEDAQRELLLRSERERWSVRRLEHEAARRRRSARARGEPSARRGRPAGPRFVREIEGLARVVLEDRRFHDLERSAELADEEIRDLCAALFLARRRCDDLHGLLTARLRARELRRRVGGRPSAET